MKFLKTCSLVIMFVALIFSACKEEKLTGGDACEFEHFSDTVVIVKLLINEDYTIGNVSFKPVEKSTDTTCLSYEVDESELAGVKKNFPVEFLNTKKGVFVIEGEQAISGTCIPYTLEKITLVK